MNRPRTLWIAALVLLAVLVVAWIDGGDEPVRPISEPVALPEIGQ